MAVENRQLNSMLRTARERLAGRDPELIARSSGAVFANGKFCLASLGQTVRISYPSLEASPELSQWHLLPLLHYLDLADGTPASLRQMPFSRCRDGMVRGGGFDRDAENAIRDRLGTMQEDLLVRRCLALGAKPVASNADLCMRFSFAPHCPMWLKLWFADEEFPASGRMFIDENADHCLAVEDAVTVGALILDFIAGGTGWI